MNKPIGRLILTAVAENSFYGYLTKAVNDEESLINCEGRKQGYYLISTNLVNLSKVETPKEEVVKEERKRKEKESHLYPIALTWLRTQRYRCEDTSALRGHGKWGNPDITGLLITETVGVPDIEIGTIEVKVSLENWEQWIFEAVAHRRFSNRVYFAFAHPEEAAPKIPIEMRYYAELYHIGILVFLVSQEKFFQLCNGTLQEPIVALDATVFELYSAPFMTVQAHAKKKFLEKSLELHGYKEACTWGQPLEEQD